MYSGTSLGGGLNLAKIISGLSKTLQIANQVIPLYQKAKPMISNARSLLGVVKEFGKNTKNENPTPISVNKNRITNNSQTKKEGTTAPTFFL